MAGRNEFEERLMTEYRHIAMQISEANGLLKVLQPRLDRLLALIQTYGLEEELDRLEAGDDIKTGGDVAKNKTERIIEAATELLTENRNHWTKLSEIYDHLVRKGIPIGGKNPNSTLSAHLSNSKRFESDRTRGWRLAEKFAPPGFVAKRGYESDADSAVKQLSELPIKHRVVGITGEPSEVTEKK